MNLNYINNQTCCYPEDLGDLDPRNCRFSPSKVGTFRPCPGLLAIAGLGNEMHWTRPMVVDRTWENILANKNPTG